LDFYYFELLEIPVSFSPDLTQLRKNYYRLSRETHPDHIPNETGESANNSLLKSGDINAAYKTLADKDLRTKYILENFGLLGKDDNTPVDQDFLLEMMDVNEHLEDLELNFNQESYILLLGTLDDKETELNSLVEENIQKFENGLNRDHVLKDIRDIYLKTRYLLRIRENITNFASSLKEGL
jgi:molecular chaperone HscB